MYMYTCVSTFSILMEKGSMSGLDSSSSRLMTTRRKEDRKDYVKEGWTMQRKDCMNEGGKKGKQERGKEGGLREGRKGRTKKVGVYTMHFFDVQSAV
jgi:hypothetical protein